VSHIDLRPHQAASDSVPGTCSSSSPLGSNSFSRSSSAWSLTILAAKQRGLSLEDAVTLVVNGFVRDVLQKLPMEFMAETQKLIGISLEGSVG